MLALDIPSGIHADTGRVLGCAVRATHTVTFIALKPGLLTLDGPDHCGDIVVSDLDLPVSKLVAPSAWVARARPLPQSAKAAARAISIKAWRDRWRSSAAPAA